jgi:hypothetical protein
MDGLAHYKSFEIRFHFENDVLTLFPDAKAAFDIALWRNTNNAYSISRSKRLSVTCLFGELFGGSGIAFYVPNGFYLIDSFCPALVLKVKVRDYLLFGSLAPSEFEPISKLRFTGNSITRISGYTNQVGASNQGKTVLSFSIKQDFPLLDQKWSVGYKGKNLTFQFGLRSLISDSSLNPIDLTPYFEVSFPATHDYDFLNFIVYRVQFLCDYLHGTRCASFSEITLFGGTGEDKQVGSFVQNGKREEIIKKLGHHPPCIPVNIFHDSFRSFLSDVFYEKVYDRHIRDWPDQVRTISDSDFFVLTCGFEYEYKRIYKNLVTHTPKFLEEQNDLIGRFQGLRKTVIEDEKGYVDNAIRWMKDDSLETKLFSFFLLKSDLIRPFISRIYQGTSTSLSAIARRIAKRRNRIAHGKINIATFRDDLLDYILLEHLIYLLQLSQCSSNDAELRAAVAQLFGDSFS